MKTQFISIHRYNPAIHPCPSPSAWIKTMPTAGQRDVCGILFDFTSMRDLICSSGVMCKFFQRGKVMEYSAYLQRFDDKPLCKILGVI